jgi:lysophospholipase L1-like esterase
MRLLALALLVVQAQADRWEKDIAAYEAKDKEKPPAPGGIVFVGSSTIRLWKTSEAFPDLPVINRGFGGSQIADSVRYAERLVTVHKPRQVLLFAGGNDIHTGKTPEAVFEDYKAFVAKVRAALPETKIWFLSLFPNLAREAELPKTTALNAMIAAHAKADPLLGYIDVATALGDAEGKPRAEMLRSDKLHLSDAGYAVVNPIVRKALAP